MTSRVVVRAFGRKCAILCFAAMLGASLVALAADKSVGGSQLADALVAIQSDEEKWFYSSALFAISLEVGATETEFRRIHPGVKLDQLPDFVLTTLRQHADAIPEWVECLSDDRPSGISEGDLFGGGSSEDARKLTCGEVAAIVLSGLVPSAARGEVADQADARKRLADQGLKWHERVKGTSAESRMKAWFEAADEYQRRMFLALAIQSRLAAAYPIFEANFLERAKEPDDFLFLEVSAYVRHRRAGAKELVQQLLATLRKEKPNVESRDDFEFFASMWKLLVKYDSLDPAIQDWKLGRLSTEQLGVLLARSIDQPWAYHSMGIEPTSVFRPTMEQNLKALVAAAAQERDVEKRIELMTFAEGAAYTLAKVIERVNSFDRLPSPRFDSAEWQPTVAHLRELLHDGRERLWDDSLTSPAEKAASIVWLFWGPMQYAADGTVLAEFMDWRDERINRFDGSCRRQIAAAAEEFMAKRESAVSQRFPEDEATKVAQQFVEGDARAWRVRSDKLRWDQQLLLHATALDDQAFARRLWPRLLEFVEWTGPSPGEPSTFGALWRGKLAGQRLDRGTWKVFQDWLVSEAKEQRYWTICLESRPVRPGISLYIAPTRSGALEENVNPTLEIHLKSVGFTLYADDEKWQIVGDRLKEMKVEDDNDSLNLPRPIAAIEEQSAKATAGDDVRNGGFIITMSVVAPAKHEDATTPAGDRRNAPDEVRTEPSEISGAVK